MRSPEALTKPAEKRSAAKRSEETVGGSMRVSAWYKEGKATYTGPKGLTDKSLKMYDEQFNGCINSCIGTMKPKDVKDIHPQRILNGQAGCSSSHITKADGDAGDVQTDASVPLDPPYVPAELEECTAILDVAKYRPIGR